jgi:hypothetical protein
MGMLNLTTGRLLTDKTFYSRNPGTGRIIHLFKPQHKVAMEMPGVLPDILSCAGDSIWMRSVAFDNNLKITKKKFAHLFCSMGFLDHSWWELTYWVYGTHMFSGRLGVTQAARMYPTGRIMVFDEQEVYGYQDGYESIKVPRLVACDKNPKVKKNPDDKRKRTMVINNWQTSIPLIPEGLVLSGDILFMAGSPPVDRKELTERLSKLNVDRYETDPLFKEAEETIKGMKAGILYGVKKTDGSKVMETRLRSTPVFDGLIAADNRLYLSMKDGSVVCFE